MCCEAVRSVSKPIRYGRYERSEKFSFNFKNFSRLYLKEFVEIELTTLDGRAFQI